MRLPCKVSVSDRATAGATGGAAGGRGRFAAGTVALCQVPGSADCCVLLFTGRERAGAGVKYPLRDNVRAVLARFASEGRATLQFARPPHDLLLQAEPLPLRAFLRLLRLALDRRASHPPPSGPGASGPHVPTVPAGVSGFGVTPVAARHLPPRKLTIRRRGDYPTGGLPRTLEELRVNGVGRCSLDRGVLQLSRLRVLDVSDNCIERLPSELAELPALRELNVAANRLDRSSPRHWGWMGGRLAASLLSLNLSSNRLPALPDELVKLLALECLNVQDNLVERLPHGIGRMRRLRTLQCSDNRLSTLPGSMRNLRLQSLSLANNPFLPLSHDSGNQSVRRQTRQVWTLKECAGRKVLSCKLSYGNDDLPATLINFLDHAKYCVCGEACFSVYFKQSMTLALSSIAAELTLSPGDDGYVPVDGYFCSTNCYDACRTRYRGHIIR